MSINIHLKDEHGIVRNEFDHPVTEDNLLATATMLQLW